MTTLPTTTPMRLPRPAGPAPLALGAPPQGAPTSFQMNGADVWRVIRSNMWLILGMLVFSGIAGYGLNKFLWAKHRSYTAVGYTQVTPATSFNIISQTPISTDVNSLQIDQRTQAALLKQEALFVQVLQNPNADIRKTTWWQGFGGKVFDAKEDLVDSFRVDVVPESKLIRIGMSYKDPKACKTIVEDIVNAHLENQKTLNQNKQLERSVALNNMRQRYQFRKDEISRELRDKAAQLSIDGMGVSGRLSTKEVELQNLMKDQFDVSRNKDDASAAYEAAIRQINDGADLPTVQQEIARDPDVGDAKRQLSGLQIAAGNYSALGAAHPDRIKFQMMVDSAQQKVDDAVATVRARTTAMIVEGLRQQKESTESQHNGIKERVDASKADMGDLTNALNQYLTLKDDEQTTRELLNQYQEQIDQISNSGSTDNSTIQWATHPETPDAPSFPKLPWTMGISIVAGLAISLGIAFTRELLDTSIRSPRDIARVGQLNLLGIIPHEDEDPQAAGAPLPQVIFQAPHSMMAEQYRQVRSRLQHAASLDSTRSLMVTSPSPGDGKTTVACNLAAGLALNGRRILLVDANFRRPELHKVFGLPNDQGFSATLNSIDNFSASVCQTQVPNLDVLPSGPRPTNSTELIESQLLIDFIERALEEYDHVIFDSGPFLFVSETVALAPRVDGVVTVVRARANSRGLLQRLRDDLRKTKAEHLGVVLNAVRAQAGGYYNRNIKTYYAYQNGHAA
ncbi:MAG: polysaccharide biosynthesis tyrosine autokinase [Tepidisphaeraceae bacterium]